MRHLKADARHGFAEELAVLAHLDGRKLGADEFNAVLLQHARLGKRHGAVEPRLSAESRQQRIGALDRDDLLHEFGGHGLDVRAVSELRVRHDRGRVAIHEDDLEAILPKNLARLGARVIELARLADDDRT